MYFVKSLPKSCPLHFSWALLTFAIVASILSPVLSFLSVKRLFGVEKLGGHLRDRQLFVADERFVKAVFLSSVSPIHSSCIVEIGDLLGLVSFDRPTLDKEFVSPDRILNEDLFFKLVTLAGYAEHSRDKIRKKGRGVRQDL